MPVSSRSTKLNSIAPYWQSDCGRATIYLGDCRDVMLQMEPKQFHALVTDPPYEIGFMSRGWDSTGVAYDKRTWSEALHVAKPGAHLLSFGGTRAYHRMACAVEDSGWEIRDCIMWVYGTGFPKGHDISKGIDKLLGAERGTVDQVTDRRGDGTVYDIGHSGSITSSRPVTEAAQQWDGWNTQLKPAYEPIIMARKSLAGTVVDNTLEHGCGGVNVDGCRVGTTRSVIEKYVETKISSGSGIYQFNSGDANSVSMNGGFTKKQMDGRCPANFIHDGSEEVLSLLPSGAARFFYTAKADDSDRAHSNHANHPTVKPLDLMCYLVRLVCAKGGALLDPFMGSGSTGCACIEESVYFVGIEQSKEYADLAVDRMKEMLGTHPIITRLSTGKRVVCDTPPPPKKLR